MLKNNYKMNSLQHYNYFFYLFDKLLKLSQAKSYYNRMSLGQNLTRRIV